MKDRIDIDVKGHSSRKDQRAMVIAVLTTIILGVFGALLGGSVGTIFGAAIGVVISIALIFVLPPTVKETDTDTIVSASHSDESSGMKDGVDAEVQNIVARAAREPHDNGSAFDSKRERIEPGLEEPNFACTGAGYSGCLIR